MSRTINDVIAEAAEFIRTWGTGSGQLYADEIARHLVFNAEPRLGRVYIEVPRQYTAFLTPVEVSFEAYDEHAKNA